MGTKDDTWAPSYDELGQAPTRTLGPLTRFLKRVPWLGQRIPVLDASRDRCSLRVGIWASWLKLATRTDDADELCQG